MVLRRADRTGDPAPEDAADGVAVLRAMLQSVSDWPRMRTGYDNDEAEFASLGELPLGRITCPTMIIRGEVDHAVLAAHAEHAHAAIGD